MKRSLECDAGSNAALVQMVSTLDPGWVCLRSAGGMEEEAVVELDVVSVVLLVERCAVSNAAVRKEMVCPGFYEGYSLRRPGCNIVSDVQPLQNKVVRCGVGESQVQSIAIDEAVACGLRLLWQSSSRVAVSEAGGLSMSIRGTNVC